MKADTLERKLKEKCQEYDVISFDVFDTLLKRNIGNPSDIFYILKKIAEEIKIIDFDKIRKEAEKEIRDIQSFATIDEIYNIIAKKIGKRKC